MSRGMNIFWVRMDFQNLFILITGRERMAYTVLDYLEEGYMELALILKT